jgi:hypothetical protein
MQQHCMAHPEFPMVDSFPRKRRLSPKRRRALALLASDRHGVNQVLLIHGHGVTRRMLAGLVRAGLATVQREVIMAGGKTVEVLKLPAERTRLG